MWWTFLHLCFSSVFCSVSLEMDNLLCDELIQEILQRLPSSSSTSTSLVCKRWLHLYRTSKTSISLRISTNDNSLIPSLSSFLSLYPSLSSLSIISDCDQEPCFSISSNILICIASTCSNLRRLQFSSIPVSFSSLLFLSSSCKHLTSLTISSSLPNSFRWLSSLPFLKELCFTKFRNRDGTGEFEFDEIEQVELDFNEHYDVSMSSLSSRSSELPLEILYLSKIGFGDRGLGWLWRNCSKLKKLGLRSCEGIGDGNSFTSFINCLKGLKELELRTCRTIVDGILFQLAEHCRSLNSLLLYDGGSREGLHQFFNQSESPLQKLDLRLPLDLGNNHLLAVAENFRGLVSLRLQSCCLVTGEGLKTIGSTMSIALEELALINCDVVEREPGLLTTLGQNLKGLKKLDLSYNEMLVDKEFVSMLISCQNLIDIRLRGCKKLTHFAVVSMSKCCKFLEDVDIMHCATIEAESVELFILSSMKLRRVQVEERKLTDAAKKWASQKGIEIIA